MRVRFATLGVLALVLASASARSEPLPFADEIARFVAEDAASPARGCETLFVGSSSIRLWPNLSADFPGRAIIQRGFGGAQIADVNLHFEQVAGRYHPGQIVFYAGENDLNAGKSVDQVMADFDAFMAMKRRAHGSTVVHFVSLKPSLARTADLARQREINRRLARLAASRADLVFVDVARPMQRGGRARPDLFGPDGLHMNAAGYAIWRKVIGASLRRTRAAVPAECR